MSSEWKNWANLPDDILALIMEKLIRADRIMISSSCKDWSNCYRKINTTNNNKEVLPWLLGYHSGKNLMELSDPAGRTGYYLKPKPPSHIDFNNIELVDSRNGWVLFLSRKNWGLFFYSPFTNEIIELPKLDMGFGLAGTFSSIPTSPDCVVMIDSRGDKKTDYVEVNIFRFFGDKCWRTIKLLKPKRGWEEPIVQMVNVGDCFYCLFGDGEMSVLNVEIGECKILPSIPGEEESYRFDDVLFVEGGDVFLHRHDSMWRLDLDLDEWVPDSVKKEQVVFVSSSRLISTALSIPAIGNAEEFGGTIFDYLDKPNNITYTAWENPALQWYIWIKPPFQKPA